MAMVFGVVDFCAYRKDSLKGLISLFFYTLFRFCSLRLSLLSLDSCNNSALMSSGTEFKVPDSLPCARSLSGC
jgi:hypothetical protein